MLKRLEKKLEALPMNTPLEQIREFIDAYFHDVWKTGRTTNAIRTGKYHRASV